MERNSNPPPSAGRRHCPASNIRRKEDGVFLKVMATGHLLNDEAEALRMEIRNSLPYGQDWLLTPHQLLGGDTPEERILAGDLEAVNSLFHSILYVGVV
jgi:hypothetical protein